MIFGCHWAPVLQIQKKIIKWDKTKHFVICKCLVKSIATLEINDWTKSLQEYWRDDREIRLDSVCLCLDSILIKNECLIRRVFLGWLICGMVLAHTTPPLQLCFNCSGNLRIIHFWGGGVTSVQEGKIVPEYKIIKGNSLICCISSNDIIWKVELSM